MNKIFGLAILALCLAACQNSGNEGRATTTAPATPSFSAPLPPIKTDSDNQTNNANTPATSPATTTTNTTALNPAHGQPGHRCDIPEGAPLNSAPVSTTIPANTTVSPVVGQPTPPPASKSVKLNPAHGLPGHDCTIAVGQPLKS